MGAPRGQQQGPPSGQGGPERPWGREHISAGRGRMGGIRKAAGHSAPEPHPARTQAAAPASCPKEEAMLASSHPARGQDSHVAAPGVRVPRSSVNHRLPLEVLSRSHILDCILCPTRYLPGQCLPDGVGCNWSPAPSPVPLHLTGAEEVSTKGNKNEVKQKEKHTPLANHYASDRYPG